MTNQTSPTQSSTFSDKHETRILIVNPMPPHYNANQRVEDRIHEYLHANPCQRTIKTDVLRVDVSVPKVLDHEAPTATYNVDKAQYKTVTNALKSGYYHGVHVLGAACDHVAFNNTHNRHLIIDIFDLAIEAKAGLFTICNGSFEYLNHKHQVVKGVNELPSSPTSGSVNPETLKIIGHFQNQVSDRPSSNKTAQAFKDALKKATILPTGRVGYMQDLGIQRLAKEGVLEILATSPDMAGRPDAQISALYDFAHNAICVAPHPEYDRDNLKNEAERDHGRKQGRTKTPALADIPNLYVERGANGKAPWYDAGVALYASWVETINHAQQITESANSHAPLAPVKNRALI
jgi:homoserine O-succinyltransferase